jgi:hypothetical protein
VAATGAGSATGGQAAAKSTKVVTDKGSHVVSQCNARLAAVLRTTCLVRPRGGRLPFEEAPQLSPTHRPELI